MKVKSFLLSLVMLSSVAAFAGNAGSNDPVNNKATIKEKVANMTADQRKARAVQLKQRVNEINTMDFSQLTKAEKKELRKEVKAIRQEARYLNEKDVAVVILGGALFTVLLLLLIA